MPQRSRKPFYSELTRNAASGYEFAGAVVIFVLVGIGLDALLGTTPVFSVTFSVFGFVAGFLRLVYADKYEAARRKAQGLPEVTQREVPEVLREEAAAARGPATMRDITTYADWKPRRFGDPVPDELRAGPGGVGA